MVKGLIAKQALSRIGSNVIGAAVDIPYLHVVTACSYTWIKSPYLFK